MRNRTNGRRSRGMVLLGVVAGVFVLAGCGLLTKQMAGTNPVAPTEEGDVGIDNVTFLTITSPTTASPAVVPFGGGNVTINVTYKVNNTNNDVEFEWTILTSPAITGTTIVTPGAKNTDLTTSHTLSVGAGVTPGFYDVRVRTKQPPTGASWDATATQTAAVQKQAGPDTTPPTVAITYPVEGVCYGNTYPWTGAITGTATDVGGTVAKVEVYVDGSYVGDADISGLPNWTFTYTPPECNRTVRAKAYDNSGNWAWSTLVNFVYDVTAPVVTINAPVNGACYQNAPAGAYMVVEAHGYTVAESGWSDDEGVHTYTVTATDCAGNVGSASVTYTVDRTPPVVTIYVPANGACFIVGTTVNASFAVADNLDPNPTVTSTVPNGSPIDTSTTGTKTFTVTATDCAGNSTTVTNTYYVVLPTFRGINPPYGSRPSIKRGSTFPIKWGWTACNQLADSSTATGFELQIYRGSDNLGTKLVNTDAGKSGGPRYDPIAKQWIFNWQVPSNYATGTYAIYIVGTPIWPGGGPFLVTVTR